MPLIMPTWSRAVVAEAWDKQSLGVDDDDRFRVDSMDTAQTVQLLWPRVIKVAGDFHVSKVDLFRESKIWAPMFYKEKNFPV